MTQKKVTKPLTEHETEMYIAKLVESFTAAVHAHIKEGGVVPMHVACVMQNEHGATGVDFILGCGNPICLQSLLLHGQFTVAQGIVEGKIPPPPRSHLH